MTQQDGGTNVEGGGDSLLGDPTMVRDWLANHHPKQLALLDKFEIELRLGRLSAISSNVGDNNDGNNNNNDNSSSSKQQQQRNTNKKMDRRTVTVRTVELLKMMIGGTKWKTPAQLVTLLRGIGKELYLAGGFREPAIGNVVRRVIAAVREEVMNINTAAATTDENNQGGGTGGSGLYKNDRSLEGMLWALPQHVVKSGPSSARSVEHTSQQSSSNLGGGDIIATASVQQQDLPPVFYQPNRPDLKQSLMEAIQEITSELEDLHKNICDQSTNQIHSGEIILTYGRSQTVELFLKAAAEKKLRFTVIICEGAPHYEGHDCAKSLAVDSNGMIETIVIHDTALFAMMARVNKVILPAHAVLANGGLICPSGSNMVTLAAKQNAVPVICLTGMFKLTPLFPHHGQDTLNDLLSPSHVFDRYDHDRHSGSTNDNGVGGKATSNNNNSKWTHNPAFDDVDFVNPIHDYIRPELINLYVTNVGSFQPSYIYRLLAEYYDSDDWDSF